MSDKIKVMTNDNFQQLVSGAKILAVDVWAEWCGPCKRSTPVFEELAEQLSNENYIFAELDAQNNTVAAGAFKVMSLPTFLIFKDGKLHKKWSGAHIDRLRKELIEASKLV